MASSSQGIVISSIGGVHSFFKAWFGPLFNYLLTQGPARSGVPLGQAPNPSPSHLQNK